MQGHVRRAPQELARLGVRNQEHDVRIDDVIPHVIRVVVGLVVPEVPQGHELEAQQQHDGVVPVEPQEGQHVLGREWVAAVLVVGVVGLVGLVVEYDELVGERWGEHR